MMYLWGKAWLCPGNTVFCQKLIWVGRLKIWYVFLSGRFYSYRPLTRWPHHHPCPTHPRSRCYLVMLIGDCLVKNVILKKQKKTQQVQHNFEVRIIVTNGLRLAHVAWAYRECVFCFFLFESIDQILRWHVSTNWYFNYFQREAVMVFISTAVAFRLTPIEY